MLRVDGINKTFNAGTPHEVQALREMSFRVDKGEFVVIIGTNGSGKSTLLNVIAGTFPVDSGTIHLAEQDITQQPEHLRAKYIGRVFQNPFLGTAPNMTIAENLILAARRGKRRDLGWALRRDLVKRFKERLGSLNLGLEGRLEDVVGTLSGGQRQLLSILMATWLKPELLLLDEHTAALDPKSAGKVIYLTEEIIEKEKLTVLMVTHSMHQAANLGDRLIMMDKGGIIHDFKGSEKKRLRVDDLLIRFENVRREEQLDISAAELLKDNYI